MNITFHIVFTPGTVKYLRLFTISLLKWLPCSLRLVPNGCAPEEVRMLHEVCRRHAQAEVVRLPWDRMRGHQIVLNYLHQQNPSEYFGFMDSDILATGDFLSELFPLLEKYGAVFSGLPFWRKDEHYAWPWHRRMRFIQGEHLYTTDGRLLGCAYFAMYHQAMLTEFMKATDITFKAYDWHKLPLHHQERLRRLGLKARGYDTGKVLNIFLQDRGEQFIYRDSPDLHHIGGFSYFTLPREARRPGKHRIFRTLKRPFGQLRDWLFYYDDTRQRQANSHIRQICVQYFTELLTNTIDQKPIPPTLTVQAQNVRQSIERLRNHILDLYQEFRAELSS